MSTNKYDYSFIFIILGESDVGKQDFLFSYTGYSISEANKKIGIDFRVKTIQFENKLVRLQIWDTAGEERFRTVTATYYKGAHGIILMYDVTNYNSFKNIRNRIEQIDEENVDKSVKIVLVGHKCDDSNRVVTEEEGQNLADIYDMGFFESSAKINKNVSEVFYYLVKEIFIEKGIIKDKSEAEKRKKKIREKKEKLAKKNLNYLMKYINF